MSSYHVHSIGVLVKRKSFAFISVLDHHSDKLLYALLLSSSTTKTTFNCNIYVNVWVSGQTETSGRTVGPKISLDSFHPIRILGEGGFGRVMLVKKTDGSEQRFAMKAIKKSFIISCCSSSYTISEKEALVLATGHPFITTLHWCFQTKVISIF